MKLARILSGFPLVLIAGLFGGYPNQLESCEYAHAHTQLVPYGVLAPYAEPIPHFIEPSPFGRSEMKSPMLSIPKCEVDVEQIRSGLFVRSGVIDVESFFHEADYSDHPLVNDRPSFEAIDYGIKDLEFSALPEPSTGLLLVVLFLGSSLLWRRPKSDGMKIARSNSTRRRSRISRVPGSSLRSVVKLIVPAKTFNRVFNQVFSDWQVDYIDALADEELPPKWRIWKARWISCLWYVILGMTIVKLVGVNPVASFVAAVASQIRKGDE